MNIDRKPRKLAHADAGEMHPPPNFAREHWAPRGDNPPVGLILCAEEDSAVTRSALEGLPSEVLAAGSRTALPEERELVDPIERTRRTVGIGPEPGRREGRT